MKLNLGGIKRDTPENRTERVHKFVIEHKAVSGFTVAVMTVLFWRIIPFTVFDFIPDAVRRFTVFFVLGNLLAWLPARWSYRKLRDLPADVIYVVNPSDRQKIRKGYFLQGKFLDEFEMLNGRPLSWTNSAGLDCYYIIGIDEDEKKAYCPPLGDYTPDEILAFEEAWKQQRVKNDKERRVGAQIRMKMGQIKSKVVGAVSNAWIRDLDRIEFEDHVEDEVDDILPDELQVEKDLDIGSLEDLEKMAEEPVKDRREGDGYGKSE